jgi:diketogulonate reductase-like aldo/keto reductase
VQNRVFGKTGVEAPIIGLGTWNLENDDRAEAVRAIHAAIEAGMTHIDTAEMYGSGKVEELLKEALKGRRDKVFLATKVMPGHASYKGTLKACDQSLERLGTDRIDLYLIHWPGQYPLEDTIRAFEELKKAGKIRAYGVSNFDVAKLEEATNVAGEGKIACDQVLYHLEERDIEHKLVPWCQKRGIAVVGYSPFGSSRAPWISSEAKAVLEAIAKERHVTAHAVALAFLVREDGLFAIPKTSNAQHVKSNARAGNLKLADDDLKRIDKAFPRAKLRRSLPTI